jgi:thioredoxin-dependent peroxiredoxin
MRQLNSASKILAMLLCLSGNLATADEKKEEEKKVDLQPGDKAPVFESIDDQGKPWKSTDLVGKKFVVVYFYPADFTPGCRAQAQQFRDNMNKLAENGVVVIGVSGDAVLNHDLFKRTEKINFTLLADEKGSLAKQFGVPLGKGGEVRPRDALNKPILGAGGEPMVLKREVTAARWTFIIGMDGKIAYKNTKVNPALDSKQVGEFIKSLQKNETQ